MSIDLAVTVSAILFLMCGAGIAGAKISDLLTASNVTAPPEVDSAAKNAAAWWKNIPVATGATFLVPLFLQSAKSELVPDLFKNPVSADKIVDFFLFGSYCLVAAISARRFIESVSRSVVSQIEEIKKQASKAQETANRVMDAQENVVGTASAAYDATVYGTSSHAEPNLSKAGFAADPTKNQFGGKPENNGRRLSATTRPVPERPDWRSVKLEVVSTDSNRPLSGRVDFHLHPSFGNAKPIVPVINGRAELNLISWGAFTVGAVCDDGNTQLELDLSLDTSAPSDWRKR